MYVLVDVQEHVFITVVRIKEFNEGFSRRKTRIFVLSESNIAERVYKEEKLPLPTKDHI